MTQVGAGIGGFAAIAAQPTYGSTFVTPTRALTFKTCKMTYDPHIVQGGPYLAESRMVDIASAHIATWLDAKGTLTGDVVNIGHALLFATAFGSGAQLTAMGTTTAYELGGTSLCLVGAPDLNNGATSGCCFDMQLGVPDAGGTLHPENYHSTMITKAEWVFERSGLSTFSYDLDSQYVEKATALITPTFAAAPVPFNMSGTSCIFKVGAFGSEAAVDGVRKATFTAEHKLSVDRIYLGNQYKDLPVSNERIDITVALEVDYTSAAKTAIFDLFLAGTAVSIVSTAIGNAIGASGHNDTFGLNATNCFVQTGGESPIDGPDMLKNTITLKGTISASGTSALIGTLITGDTTF